MKKIRQRTAAVAVATALSVAPVPALHAEDIDLFVGAATNKPQNPNILIVIDNSSNWSAANQGWAGGIKQGQAELAALRTLAAEVGDNVNLGVMLFTGGSGSNINGAYPRFHVRQMTTTNKNALIELIGDSTCAAGSNSLNGTPNCIYNNFDGGEKVSTATTDYGAGLFEVFKYFGGYTSPAHATDGVAGTPVDTTAGPSAKNFGAVRFSGNPDSKTDPAAFVGGSGGLRTTYNSPITSSNACAKNYVILIGNGFPVSDQLAGSSTPPTTLTNVGGTTSQLSMPTYTTLASGSTVSLGTDTACHTTSACAAAAQTNVPTFQGYPLSSWSCTTQSATTSTGCATGTQKNLLMRGVLAQVADVATGSSAVPASNKRRYADEWANFLFTTDVNAATGQQNVQTYTIDVFKDQPDTDQSALLASMAKFGGGKYFQATSQAAILDALRKTIIEIQSLNSVFASASLPINATNRSQNENQVFIGMFRPDGSARPRWYGNLKRYQIALFDGAAKIADKNGLDAVAATTTGFLHPCATSFWTTDSGTYWSLPADAGSCTTSSFDKYSDSPDGALVEKGAAAEMLRKGNNPPTTDTTPTFAVNRTVYTCTDSASCKLSPLAMDAFNSTNVSQAALGAADTTEQQAIVDYTLGTDIGDENSVAGATDVRVTVHGDVAHSRPLPVNYGGTIGVVLYYGANDGAFRALRGSDGKELWAFIAPEHHSMLKRLKDNQPVISYPGISASISPTPQRKDYFFDGSAGVYETFDSSNNATKVWIYPSMRRGGRMLYAFDVTTHTAPKMKWRAGCPNLANDTGCTSGFSQIGQTWSIPSVATVKGFSTSTPVVIVGGGYDSCEDADSSAPSCGSTKGNRVYVINADTGALIRTFNTDRAVVGDVTLIDRDFDSSVDHAYVADTGGNLYRIDFVDPSTLVARTDTSTWTITKIASTSGAGRKFLFGPAALPSTGKVFLTLSSGDRERPLVNNYPYTTPVTNRAYMYIDTFATTGLPVDLDGSTMNNFTSGSSCSTTLASDKPNGWFFDLTNGRGEQGVTSSIIFGGLVFFSTNFPDTTSSSSCSNNLGKAAGYAVNLLNGSGAVGTLGICDGSSRSGVFTGGGLPPSPVTGTVPIDGKDVTVMIGGIDRSGGASSPIGSQKVTPTITQKRQRLYWYRQGDK